MTRSLLILLLLIPAATSAPEAQVSPVVRYGKWVLLAGSAGMNLLAARAHDRADDAYERLTARCIAVRSRCDLTGDGRYLDPESEALYQGSLRNDRRARHWLLGGEAALLGAAAMFVWELTRRKSEPSNIPFEPEIESRHGSLRIGVRTAF